jgi:ubiquinone/menaquinone biosynthesis C-methylase UbiE
MKISSFKYKLKKLYWGINSFIWDDYLYKTGLQKELEILSDDMREKINKPEANVLDVGTATGAFAISLAEKGFNVTGIDFSFLMLQKAKKKIVGKDVGDVSFIGMDFNRKLDFNDNNFDLVICIHSFNGALDKNIFVEEIKRVCVNEGLVFVVGKYHNMRIKRKYKKGFLLFLIHIIKPFIFQNQKKMLTQKEVIQIFSQHNFSLLDEKLSDYGYSLLFSLEK